MSDLFRDYVALPEVQFLVRHWLAVLVWVVAILAAAWWLTRRKP